MEGIKIRGIYSTALTKYLSDLNYKIANPSLRMKQRINIEYVDKADTIIYDKEDKNGIIIYGKQDRNILNDLKKELKYIIFKEIKKGEIYVGEIKDVVILGKDKYILIKLNKDDKFGYLPLSEYWGIIKKGQKVLVQIKGYKNGVPLLTTNLRLFGDDLVLIEKGYSKVSKYLNNKEEKERLLRIARDYQGFGILWKATAENKDENYLREEIQSLIKELEKLKKEYKNYDIGLIREGQRIIFVDFSYVDKRKLDDIRDKVVGTLKLHHIIRRSNVGPIIDFGEKLLNKIDREVLNKTLIETYYEHSLPNIGKSYIILHRKINSRDIKIRGKIIEKDLSERKIILQRTVRTKGVYDGLEIEKEVGDIIITKLYEGSWVVIHEYYDKNNNLKGKYYSINTPIEFYPNRAEYIDLELDVVEYPDGSKKVVDENKLELIKDNITEELYKKIHEIKNYILNNEIEKCLEKNII